MYKFTHPALGVDAEPHFEAALEWRHVRYLLQPERLEFKRVDGDSRVADQPELRLTDRQVVHGVLVA